MTENVSGAIYGPTPGISRNMQADAPALRSTPGSLGGGDLNGTAATSILIHQSGTDGSRWQTPRKFANPGNWCGIV